MLDEVKVVSDKAITRETPVAFSNVPPVQLAQELAGRDIPMVLNSTPGVYATEQGGGDGDARITISGFSQNNVAVMIDGIPMNDMENGWVYWSNWFGLDDVTRNIQVQRGLGASKLALPTVGGTINILTKGIESKRNLSENEIDSEGKFRTSLAYSSGVTPGAGLFRWQVHTNAETDGWIIPSLKAGFISSGWINEWGNTCYCLRLRAPQHHEQRAYQLPIAAYDVEYAKDREYRLMIKITRVNFFMFRLYNNMGISIISTGGCSAETVSSRCP